MENVRIVGGDRHQGHEHEEISNQIQAADSRLGRGLVGGIGAGMKRVFGKGSGWKTKGDAPVIFWVEQIYTAETSDRIRRTRIDTTSYKLMEHCY